MPRGVPPDGPDVTLQSQADRAYTELLRAIATCELAPGTWFNEREMAASLQMSRTPFRQALHRLALEGLVESVPKRGVLVKLLDLDDMRDNFIVRTGIEVEMVRRAIGSGDVDARRLAALTAEMRATGRRDDVPAFLAADEAFHLTIAASNRRASEALQRTWVYLNRARHLSSTDGRAAQQACREHAAIVAAVRRRDVTAAESAVRAHLERSMQRLEDLTAAVPEAFVAAG